MMVWSLEEEEMKTKISIAILQFLLIFLHIQLYYFTMIYYISVLFWMLFSNYYFYSYSFILQTAFWTEIAIFIRKIMVWISLN